MKERHLEHHAFEQWASEEQVVRYASMALVEYRATQNQAAVVSVPALEITPAEIHRRAQEAMPQPLSRTDMVRGGADSGRSAPNPISGLVELASQVRVERAHDGGVVVVNDGPYTVHQPSVVEVAGDWSGGELDAVAPAVIEPGTMWRAGFLPAGHGTSPTRPAYRVQLTWCDDGGLGLHLYERSLLFDL